MWRASSTHSAHCDSCGEHFDRHGMHGDCPRLEAPVRKFPSVTQDVTSKRTLPEAGYEQLANVLDRALEQAQSGKGRERHAANGEPFQDQKIVQLCEWMGSTHGAVFQAAKKAIESTRLPPDRAEAELLGAINYLAAAVLVLRRRLP